MSFQYDKLSINFKTFGYLSTHKDESGRERTCFMVYASNKGAKVNQLQINAILSVSLFFSKQRDSFISLVSLNELP